jgi:heme/copper-type cytochrome/quinol oxidase subunit 1
MSEDQSQAVSKTRNPLFTWSTVISAFISLAIRSALEGAFGQALLSLVLGFGIIPVANNSKKWIEQNQS